MFLLVKPEVKILLFSILILGVNKKNWKESVIVSKGNRLHNFSSFIIISILTFGTYFINLVPGSKHKLNLKSLQKFFLMRLHDYGLVSPFLQNNLELSPPFPSFFKNLNPYNYRKRFTLC